MLVTVALKRFLCQMSLSSVQCSFWLLSLCSVQCSLWSLPLCNFQCSLWSLSLWSLLPLCIGNERSQSSYSLRSKRCSNQSLLPFQASTVPKILTSDLLLSVSRIIEKFCSHSIIFPANLQTCQHIHNAI
jgi:hypothetical protein